MRWFVVVSMETRQKQPLKFLSTGKIASEIDEFDTHSSLLCVVIRILNIEY
jgi:hypothetical protein